MSTFSSTGASLGPVSGPVLTGGMITAVGNIECTSEYCIKNEKIRACYPLTIVLLLLLSQLIPLLLALQPTITAATTVINNDGPINNDAHD